MKKTKLAKFAAASLLAVSVALTGCGGDKAPEGGGGTTGGEGGGDQTLTVWTWDPAFNIFSMKEAEKIYQKDHPGFKLDIQETPWDDLQTKLTTLAQSSETKQLPDIFLMQNNALQEHLVAEGKLAVQRVTADRMAAAYTDIYKQVLNLPDDKI